MPQPSSHMFCDQLVTAGHRVVTGQIWCQIWNQHKILVCSMCHNPVHRCFANCWSQLVTGWSHVKSDGTEMCATTHLLLVLLLACHIWSKGGHRSNLMPDSESAQNFGSVTCATTQLLHILLLAGHIWLQGDHRSNLMPDLESAQKIGTYCLPQTSSYMFCNYLVTGWSQVKFDARFGISAKFCSWVM